MNVGNFRKFTVIFQEYTFNTFKLVVVNIYPLPSDILGLYQILSVTANSN